MSELDDFLGTMLSRQIEAERAIHNGDAEPRLEMWSRNDPVSVVGALGVQWSGWEEVSEGFRWLAARLFNCQRYEFELLAAGASGDFAYMVGYGSRWLTPSGFPSHR